MKNDFYRRARVARGSQNAMSADEVFAECVARGLCTAAQAAEAGHPVTTEGRQRRSFHWSRSSDPDVRAAFEAGRLHGLDEADQELTAALSRMLGHDGTTSYREAAKWHVNEERKAERRRRSDAGDPDLMDEMRRASALVVTANRKRDHDVIEAAARIRPLEGHQAWRDFCGETVWGRVTAEYAAAGRPLPVPENVGHRHLRAVA